MRTRDASGKTPNLPRAQAPLAVATDFIRSTGDTHVPKAMTAIPDPSCTALVPHCVCVRSRFCHIADLDAAFLGAPLSSAAGWVSASSTCARPVPLHSDSTTSSRQRRPLASGSFDCHSATWIPSAASSGIYPYDLRHALEPISTHIRPDCMHRYQTKCRFLWTLLRSPRIAVPQTLHVEHSTTLGGAFCARPA